MKTRTLHVCGRRWRVVWQPVILSDSVVCWGEVDKELMTVRICSVGDPQHQQQALLHELLHVCFATTGGYPDTEEQAVKTLEVTLFDVLRDRRNRWLVEGLGVGG